MLKRIFLGLLFFGAFTACSNDDDALIIEGENALIFGHFAGECFGETCVQTFKLTDQSLYKDTMRDYNGQDMAFVKMEDELFEGVKDLIDYFPNQLLKQKETVFGCPDCTDGGGLMVQYIKNGKVTKWTIDNDKNKVPEYLHDFMHRLHKKFQLINKTQE